MQADLFQTARNLIHVYSKDDYKNSKKIGYLYRHVDLLERSNPVAYTKTPMEIAATALANYETRLGRIGWRSRWETEYAEAVLMFSDLLEDKLIALA